MVQVYEELDYCTVDSFTDRIYCGNPAAVVQVPTKLQQNSEALQLIAREFNISETAFVTPIADKPNAYHLRWFSPKAEVPLCGHATLASAHTLFEVFSANAVTRDADRVEFATVSGLLIAKKVGEDMYELDLPAGETTKADEELLARVKAYLTKAIEGTSNVVYAGVGSGVSFRKYMLVELENSLDLEKMDIDLSQFMASFHEYDVLILTVASTDPAINIKSRVFAPSLNIPEDPVTGSAHCMLAPYWQIKLGIAQDRTMIARQVSPRGGDLEVVWDKAQGRCKIRGKVTVTAIGKLRVPKEDF